MKSESKPGDQAKSRGSKHKTKVTAKQIMLGPVAQIFPVSFQGFI